MCGLGDFLRRHPYYLGMVVALSHPCAFTVFPSHFTAWAFRAALDGSVTGCSRLVPDFKSRMLLFPLVVLVQTQAVWF